jgi:hypothetical protein
MRKSAVLRTPKTMPTFPPPKVPARPPPLLDCISITTIRRRQMRISRDINTVNMEALAVEET